MTMDSVVYSRLKKVAYGSMATFFILRIYLDFIAILILEIVWVCFFVGCFLGWGGDLLVFVGLLAAFEVVEFG